MRNKSNGGYTLSELRYYLLLLIGCFLGGWVLVHFLWKLW